MKRIVTVVFSILVGVGVGWYFGYTRPNSKYLRELWQSYRETRARLHVTDQEMEELMPKIPQIAKSLRQDQEMAAMVALRALRCLELGNTNESKQTLLTAIGDYYRSFPDRGGDTNVLASIEKAAQKYPALAAELSKK